MTRPLAAALALALALPAAAGVRPRPGGTLRLLLPAEPRELDPARAASAADLLLARALGATLYEPEGDGVRPGLAEALPEVAPGGLEVRIRLRPGLRFQDGAPLGAAEVAESLARLLRPETGSPHAGLLLALEGAEAVRAGRERTPAGVAVLSERELRLLLVRPWPELARALCAPPAAVVRAGPTGLVGAGAFRLAGRAPDGMRLAPFEGHHRGRPWADAVAVSWPDAPAAVRRLSRGEADLAIRPEGAPGAPAREVGPRTLVVAQVGARLGGGAEGVRAALAGMDRAELARLVRGVSQGARGILAGTGAGTGAATAAGTGTAAATGAATAAGAGTGTGTAAATSGPRLTLLAPNSLKALADRIQVKLFDRGIRAGVELVPDTGLQARLAAGAHDLALVPIALASDQPEAVLAQVALALGGAEGLALAARALASGPAAAAADLEARLRVVPLALSAERLSVGTEWQGIAPAGDGSVDLAEAWHLPGRRAQTSPQVSP